MMEDQENPQEGESSPKAPPRYKRKVKMQGVKNLNLANITADEFPHQNDILFRTESLNKLAHEDTAMKGPIQILSNSPTKQWLPYWAVFEDPDCKLKIFNEK